MTIAFVHYIEPTRVGNLFVGLGSLDGHELVAITPAGSPDDAHLIDADEVADLIAALAQVLRAMDPS